MSEIEGKHVGIKVIWQGWHHWMTASSFYHISVLFTEAVKSTAVSSFGVKRVLLFDQ